MAKKPQFEAFHAMEELVSVVQSLSLTRRQEEVIEIVRHAARRLTGADGATFVLREGNQCFYAEEDAIEPLWKGKRFPMSACISGWAMLHRQSVVIEDIYQDARIPADAYRPTFVKSLLMVPIRQGSPIGAIGNYWASTYKPTDEQVKVLQALANTTAVAIENLQLQDHLVQTQKMQALGHMATSIAHEINNPVAVAHGRIEQLHYLINQKRVTLEQAPRYLTQAAEAVMRISDIVKGLQSFSRNTSREALEDISLRPLVQEAIELAKDRARRQNIELRIAEIPPELSLHGRRGQLGQVLINLLNNACDAVESSAEKWVAIDVKDKGESIELWITDSGHGIAHEFRDKILEPFFSTKPVGKGTGLGLSVSRAIVESHYGSLALDFGCPHTRFVISLPRVPAAAIKKAA